MCASTRIPLESAGLGGLTVIHDCPISRWELVTAPYPGLPFRTSEAYELYPASPGVLERISE